MCARSRTRCCSSDAVVTSKTGTGVLNPADLVLVTDSFTRIATRTRQLDRHGSVSPTHGHSDAANASQIRCSSPTYSPEQPGRSRTLTDLVALTDHVLTQKLGGEAPILNYAIDIRWGEIQADNVYVGEELVWSP